MSYVFVVDQQRQPQGPVHPGRARFLLTAGHAAVLRRYPFTIILREARPATPEQPLRLKLDPGSKTTGIAVVTEPEHTQEGRQDTTIAARTTQSLGQVVWAAELVHRGQQVTKNLDQRRACRRSRRSRHTRYRACRYDNRTRTDGWVPPSLESRIANVLTWVQRLQRLCPIGAVSLELAKFDTQLLQNAEISGIMYQQGELAGYETREYLLEKWGRRCAYCRRTDSPLQIEHIVPKSRGGSDRVSNLTLACQDCNQQKDTQTAAEFGHPEVEAQAKQPLRDAAALNATRWALFHRLKALGKPVETGTGGRTKWNRTTRGLPKAHWVDAACVGASTPQWLHVAGVVPLLISAQGRHSRQMCRTNPVGFPDKTPKVTSVVGGVRTGDHVRAVVPARSTKAGTYVGRIAIRATGSCNIKTAYDTIQGIHYRYCQPLHQADGYVYAKGGALPPRA
jgi:5-methylcytosine-specific restriction endonuclease McrA